MPAKIFEKQRDANILKKLSAQPLGHNQLLQKCGMADNPLRRRLEWLMNRRYVSRPNRHWKRGRQKLYSITKKGSAYYEKIRDAASIQRAAIDLGNWRITHDKEKMTELSTELFTSAFRFVYTRFHETRNIKIYEIFMNKAEMAIQNFLNEKLAKQDIGNRNGRLRSVYFEFYMGIIRRASEALREDGKLAYKSGHGLTKCHVDLLCDQLKLYDKRSLLLHNEKWLKKRMKIDVYNKLEKELNIRRRKIEPRYPGAYVGPFGLDNPGKRGLELALPNSKS